MEQPALGEVRVARATLAVGGLTGDVWTPAEIQETVWSWAKTLKEKAGGKSSTLTD